MVNQMYQKKLMIFIFISTVFLFSGCLSYSSMIEFDYDERGNKIPKKKWSYKNFGTKGSGFTVKTKETTLSAETKDVITNVEDVVKEVASAAGAAANRFNVGVPS